MHIKVLPFCLLYSQGFDAEQLLNDVSDLKKVIKEQDKKIAALEKRIDDFEETPEEVAI